MSPKIEHAVSIIVGVFCLSLVGAAVWSHGWYAIVVMLIGLLVLAAILQGLLGEKFRPKA